MKLAVTLCADDIVTTHVPVPVQAPDQPLKSESAAATGVRLTRLPWVKGAEQVAPHERPAGDEVTVPVPVPTFDTVSAWVVRLKVAVTVVAAVIVTVQVPVPVQPPPLQPAKVEPDACTAVSVTGEPWAKEAAQVAPQLMPAGEEVTVPVPPPVLTTVRA